MEMNKFIVIGEVGDGLAIAHRLANEGSNVTYFNCDKQADEVGIGFKNLKRVSQTKTDLHSFVMKNKDAIFLFDGSEKGSLQDRMRKLGLKVIGSSSFGDRIERDRIYGHEIAKKYGIKTPETISVENVNEAVKFLKQNKNKDFILKQTGDLPKTLNFKGKTDDIIKHLYVMEAKLGDKLSGKLVIQEYIKGYEVAICGMYAGDKWLQQNGKTIIELNFENKKLLEGDRGVSTGELGTVAKFIEGENEVFTQMVKPLGTELKKVNHYGEVDANCIYTEKGELYLLEHTIRNGYPISDLYTELNNINLSEFYNNWIEKKETDFNIEDWGVVLSLAVPLFPYEKSNNKIDSMIGECINISELTEEEQDHLHFYEVNQTDIKEFKNEFTVAEVFGYIGTITNKDKDYNVANSNCLNILEKIEISGKIYRRDIANAVKERISKTSKITGVTQ